MSIAQRRIIYEKLPWISRDLSVLIDNAIGGETDFNGSSIVYIDGTAIKELDREVSDNDRPDLIKEWTAWKKEIAHLIDDGFDMMIDW